jgi:choline dehydrogenase-like flavoprotein
LNFDVVVVGSGPAGVSVSFPLVQAGMRVLMLDVGEIATMPPPTAETFADFVSGPEYRRQLLGERYEALDLEGALSPKFRLPTNRYAFAGFSERYHLETEAFQAVGSLARGGLSGIWGAGVAQFSARELEAFPFAATELAESYREVGRRVGISGVGDDDLAHYLGTVGELQPPARLGTNATRLLARYRRTRPSFQKVRRHHRARPERRSHP